MRACGFIPISTLSHSQVFKTDSVESAPRVCVKICQQMGPSITSLVASGRMITQHRDRAPNNGQAGAQTMSNKIQRVLMLALMTNCQLSHSVNKKDY
jgi:hypothetical protein